MMNFSIILLTFLVEKFFQGVSSNEEFDGIRNVIENVRPEAPLEGTDILILLINI